MWDKPFYRAMAAIWQPRMDFKNSLPCCTEYLVTEFVISRTRIKNGDLCLFSLSPLFSQDVYLYFLHSSQREKKHHQEPSCGARSKMSNSRTERAKRKWVMARVRNLQAFSLAFFEMFSLTLERLAYIFIPQNATWDSRVRLSVTSKAHNPSFKL